MSKRNELLRHLPAGYTIGFPIVGGNGPNERGRKLGGSGGHPCVLRPDGTPLREASGVPIKVSNSPGSQRTLRIELVRIRRALKAQEAKR